MFPIINIGPLAIQASGFILLLSVFIGFWLSGKYAKNLGTNGDAIENGLLIGLLSGILSARIGFFLQNPSIFMENPLSLVSLTPTMLNKNFGLLIGLLAIFIYAQKQHLPLWPTLDTLTPLIILIFGGMHLASYANGDMYGLPTDLPWGIQLWNAIRHPVQLYAIILAIGLLVWLLLKTQWLKHNPYPRSGTLFLFILIGLAVTTIFTRSFVAQKSQMLGFDSLQLLAFLLLLLSLYLIYQLSIKPQKHIQVFISLGSNTNPEENLAAVQQRIKDIYKFRRGSSIYRTQDVKSPPANGSYFLNQVMEIETNLSVQALLKNFKSLERDFGRIPGDKKIVPLDIDLLTYNNDVFTYQNKKIPNPDLTQYKYIAVPLAEIASDFRHPATGKAIADILDDLQDKTTVIKIEEVENGTTG